MRVVLVSKIQNKPQLIDGDVYVDPKEVKDQITEEDQQRLASILNKMGHSLVLPSSFEQEKRTFFYEDDPELLDILEKEEIYCIMMTGVNHDSFYRAICSAPHAQIIGHHPTYAKQAEYTYQTLNRLHAGDIACVYSYKFNINQVANDPNIKNLFGRFPKGLILKNTFSSLRTIRKRFIDADDMINFLNIAKEETVRYGNKDIPKHGNELILQEYLEGDMYEVLVLPPGQYKVQDDIVQFDEYFISPFVNFTADKPGAKSKTIDISTDPIFFAALSSQCIEAVRVLQPWSMMKLELKRVGENSFKIFDLSLTRPKLLTATTSSKFTLLREMGMNYEDYVETSFLQAKSMPRNFNNTF